MSNYKLFEEIISRSEANTWDLAKLEWSLFDVYEAEEPDTCLCGHHPIIELCTLQNRINGELATVGNCCVKKFIGLPSDKIFQAIKNIRKDVAKSLNTEAINFAFEKNGSTIGRKTFTLISSERETSHPNRPQRKPNLMKKFHHA